MLRTVMILLLVSLVNINLAVLQPSFADENVKDKKVEVKADVKDEIDEASLKEYESRCSLLEPLDLVANPKKYLDKYVKLEGVFDRYTTLGLDYKPAMRESKDYITFLIRRPDVKRKNIIPLSELKMIIARKTAEKYTNLETGDDIVIFGKVFSTALNDPWVDVNHIYSKSKDITLSEKKDQDDK